MSSARITIAATHLRAAFLATAIGVVPYAVRGQTVQTGVDISVSAEAVNNPYLTDVDSSWVGAGTVEVRPWLKRTDETDSISLRGLARVRGFTSRFDAEMAFGADLAATTRLDARTTAFGNASVLTTNRRTPFDVLTPRPGLTDPIVPTPGVDPIGDPIIVLPGEDVTQLGTPGRITTSSVGAGISRQLDPSSTLGYNVDYRRLDGDDDTLGVGYESASATANYSRQLTPRTRIGVSGAASKTRYEQGRPSATSFGLSGTLAQQLGRYWFLNASAGISSTNAEGNGLFPGYSSVAPIGSVSLCYQPVRKNLCFRYMRSQQPSFLGDVRTSDSAFVSYSEQFSQRQRVDLSASYSRSQGEDEANSLYPDVEAMSLRGVFSQTINDRTEGYVSASMARSYGGFLSREPSISFGVGVRLRLGARR